MSCMGSIVHPDIAKLADDIPDKDTLDNEKKKTDELSKIRSELSSKSGVAQGKAETSHSTLLLEWNSISVKLCRELWLNRRVLYQMVL